MLLPGLLSPGIPVLFTGSGLRIAAVFCIAIYFVFISAPGNEEKKIVCFGDSLTSCGGKNGRYSDMLQKSLPSYIFINSGKGICGAEITYTIKAENQYSEFAISDKNGNFQTKAPTQWLYIVYLGSPGFYPVPDAPCVIERQLHISKNGYFPKHIVLSKAPTEAWKKTDFGVIKLSPQVP